jgi:hypothetical protein
LAEGLTIEELRGRIDVIDDQLVRLLNVRVACAVEVGRLKHEMGLAVYQPDRGLVLAACARRDGAGRAADSRGGGQNLRTHHRRGATGGAPGERAQARSVGLRTRQVRRAGPQPRRQKRDVMVVVMKERATEEQVDAVIARLIELGMDVHRSSGATRTVLGVVGANKIDPGLIGILEGVHEVLRISEPYKPSRI